MEKILKRIIIVLSFFWFLTIPKVSADELTDIYSYSTNYRNIENISYTSFGDYNSLNFSLFDTYNYTSQVDSTNPFYNNYILFYNKSYDYYLVLLFYNPGYSSGVFTATDSKTNKFYMCTDNTFTTCNNNFYIRFIYKDSNTLNNIERAFTIGTFSSKNLDNFYITYYNSTTSCNNTCINSFTKSLYRNIDEFYFIESNTDYYLNGEKQVKTTYSELNKPEEPEEPEEQPILNFKDLIYVPNYRKGQCVEILDKDTIRVFDDEYTNAYIDYYINSHYLSKGGLVDDSYIKSCSNLEFTDIRYYGNDISDILILLVCIIAFTIIPCYILFKVFYRR